MKSRVVLTVLLLFFFVALGAQITVDIVASRNNSIFQESGEESMGGSQYIYVGRTGTPPRVIDGDVVITNNHVRRALVHFDLSAIPQNAVVQSLTVKLQLDKAGDSQGDNISLHKLLSDWGEEESGLGNNGGAGAQAETGDATWSDNFYQNSKWQTNGGDFLNAPSATTSVGGFRPGCPVYEWVSNTMVSDAQSWIDGTSDNYGWILIGNESRSLSAKRFYSRLGSGLGNIFCPAVIPTLTITYTLPGSEPITSPVINEVNPKNGWVEIMNQTDASFDLSNYSLCQGTSCDNIGTTNALLIHGDSQLGSGEIVIIDWNKLDESSGEIVFQNALNTLDTSKMVDYIQYGNSSQPNVDEAIAKGCWDDEMVSISVPSDSSMTMSLLHTSAYQSGTESDGDDWNEQQETPSLENDNTKNDISLQENIISATYRAVQSITVNGSVGNPAAVFLITGKEALFSQGSEIESGSTFQVEVLDFK